MRVNSSEKPLQMVEDQSEANNDSPTVHQEKVKETKADSMENTSMDIDTANVTAELELPVDLQGTMAFYPFSSLKPSLNGTYLLASHELIT